MPSKQISAADLAKKKLSGAHEVEQEAQLSNIEKIVVQVAQENKEAIDAVKGVSVEMREVAENLSKSNASNSAVIDVLVKATEKRMVEIINALSKPKAYRLKMVRDKDNLLDHIDLVPL